MGWLRRLLFGERRNDEPFTACLTPHLDKRSPEEERERLEKLRDMMSDRPDVLRTIDEREGR